MPKNVGPKGIWISNPENHHLQRRISGIIQEISNYRLLFSLAIAFLALLVGFGLSFDKVRKEEKPSLLLGAHS